MQPKSFGQASSFVLKHYKVTEPNILMPWEKADECIPCSIPVMWDVRKTWGPKAAACPAGYWPE